MTNGFASVSELPIAIAEDVDLETALAWFLEIDSGRGSLPTRIRSAQDFFRAQAVRMDSRWPDPYDLLIKTDLIASYLAQADAFLRLPSGYDLTLAAHIIPFVKHVGAGVPFLRRMPGVVDRVRRLLNPKNEHPDGGLYELAVAVRYALETFDVEFVAESSTRAADLRVGPPGDTKELFIECKRLRASAYELREKAGIQSLFAPLRADSATRA